MYRFSGVLNDGQLTFCSASYDAQSAIDLTFVDSRSALEYGWVVTMTLGVATMFLFSFRLVRLRYLASRTDRRGNCILVRGGFGCSGPLFEICRLA